jgi:hypothetical protein
MSHRTFTLFFAVVCAAAFSVVASGAQGQAPEPNAATPAAGQSSGDGSEQNSEQPSPAKKVWTNDDLSGLSDPHGQPRISTSSPGAAKSSDAARKPVAKGKDAKWYRDNITKLQAKIPALGEQINALQAAIDGKPTGNGTESVRPRGVKADSWPTEMDALKKQRDSIQNQIDALYDEARRNDIPSNALPVAQ